MMKNPETIVKVVPRRGPRGSTKKYMELPDTLPVEVGSEWSIKYEDESGKTLKLVFDRVDTK